MNLPATSIEQLQSVVSRMLLSVGVSDGDSATTAAALATTDGMGVFTHGSKLLAGYLRKLLGGGYQAKTQPVIQREGPG